MKHCKSISTKGAAVVRKQRKDNLDWKQFLTDIRKFDVNKGERLKKYHWANFHKSFYDVLTISPEEWIRRCVAGCQLKPTTPERALEKLLLKYYSNFSYTGDGKAGIIIGRMIPDFTFQEKKKVIELYGDYWHRNDDPQDRINAYKTHGYDCLVLWERELKDENKVVERIKNFV